MAEVTNQIILQGLRNQLDGAKGNWIEELPSVMVLSNDVTKKKKGESPLSLFYYFQILIIDILIICIKTH